MPDRLAASHGKWLWKPVQTEHILGECFLFVRTSLLPSMPGFGLILRAHSLFVVAKHGDCPNCQDQAHLENCSTTHCQWNFGRETLCKARQQHNKFLGFHKLLECFACNTPGFLHSTGFVSMMTRVASSSSRQLSVPEKAPYPHPLTD